MLVELSIQNLALIDAVTIAFSPGFHVLTGETGAGKSIVVDAVNLVLGERADRDFIQTGADKARVEALFDVRGDAQTLAALDALGLETEEGMLLLSRELTQAGRNVCRVGGAMVPLATLKQVAGTLLDMHGQHEHQALLDERRHLAYLDEFGEAAHRASLEAVAAAYAAWHDARRALNQLRERLSQRDARLDMLRYQLQELDAAKLRAGEEDELERQRTFYRNAERITAGVERAFDTVYGGAEQTAALDALRAGADALAPLARLDEAYAALHERLQEQYYQLEDTAHELRALRDGLEFDPADAEAVEARMDEIHRLRRKYGQTTHDMLAARERIAQELTGLEDAEETEERLAKRCRALEEALYAQSQALSQARRALAGDFEARMRAQLADLGMPHAVFRASFAVMPEEAAAPGAYSAQGFDQVAFLLSPNLGEPEKPLARIASGGELSRIMLALKSIAAEQTGVPSMVFDEIDTGISGRMAQVVAEKMAALAKQRQVICVTHLPQIAAMADAQYLVQKREAGGHTRTHVALLDAQGRCAELARLVGGAQPESASALTHAAMLLQEAEARKEALRGEAEKQ